MSRSPPAVSDLASRRLISDAALLPRARLARERRRDDVGGKSNDILCQNCQMPPEIPVKQRDLRGHSDAHRCCGKLLIGSALVGFAVRQHA